jgi:hypothetical protein
MSVRCWLFFLCCFQIHFTLAQHLTDSIASEPYFPADSTPFVQRRGLKPTINLDNRNSFLHSEAVAVFGARLGLEWNTRYRAGIGFYWIPTELQARLNPQMINRYFVQGEQLEMYYASVYFEYVLASRKNWEISTPLQFGYGRTNLPFTLQGLFPPQPGTDSDMQNLWLLEPSVNGYYRVSPWMGLGAGVGYRHTLFASNSVEQNFNAPIWMLRAKFFVGNFFHTFKKK